MPSPGSITLWQIYLNPGPPDSLYGNAPDAREFLSVVRNRDPRDLVAAVYVFECAFFSVQASDLEEMGAAQKWKLNGVALPPR
jgi:hypothetical protein